MRLMPRMATQCFRLGRQKWLRLFEQLSPIYKWTAGGFKYDAELSTAASVACDERIAAVGNSGHTGNFILGSLFKFGQQGHVRLLGRDFIQT